MKCMTYHHTDLTTQSMYRSMMVPLEPGGSSGLRFTLRCCSCYCHLVLKTM